MMLWTFIIVVCGTLFLSIPAYAVDVEQADAPGFNPRLHQALGGEGGVEVYMDRDGNTGTVLDAGPGHRTFTVQPPQSPSLNLGPPLQLHDQSLTFPLDPSRPSQTAP